MYIIKYFNPIYYVCTVYPPINVIVLFRLQYFQMCFSITRSLIIHHPALILSQCDRLNSDMWVTQQTNCQFQTTSD